MFEINPDFKKYRQEFPHTKNLIYFNHAATGPVPISSIKAGEKFLKPNTLQDWKKLDSKAFQILDNTRHILAKLIGAHSSEIGISTNTTFGFNLVANGLNWKRGDRILLCEKEFPANVYPWLNLKRKGVHIKFLKFREKFFDLNHFYESIDSRTKLFSTSFVRFFDGYKYDLESIGKICREKNIFLVVDGIQAAGVLDIDVKKFRIDFLTCGGQKWLLSGPGTGFFYCSKEIMEKLHPAFFSWLSVDWSLDWTNLFNYSKKPFKSARKFELGTYPYPNLAAFYTSLKLLHKIGISNIHCHTKALTNFLLENLYTSGAKIKSSLEPEHRSAIFSFSTPNDRKLMQNLEKNKVLVSYRENAIRVSPHFYNTLEECQSVLEVIKKSLKKK